MPQRILRSIMVSMEAIDGVTTDELEYTFYGKVKDLNQLSEAKATEEHEQWQLPLEGGKVRARLRLINNIRPTICTKVKKESAPGYRETECDISMDLFNALKLAAVDGYKKIRYDFPIPNTNRKWEVDVFFNQSGEKSYWVKIDLEVNSPDDSIPKLPIEFTEIITNQSSQLTAEENAFIDKLWNSEWVKLDGSTPSVGNESIGNFFSNLFGIRKP